MLLQVPAHGFNSPQQRLSVEPPKVTLDLNYMEARLSPTDYRRFSWLPQSPSSPIPPEILTLRRTSSHALSPTRIKSPTKCNTNSSSSPLYTHTIGSWPISTDQHSLFAAQPPPPTIETSVLSPLLPPQALRKPTLWRPFPSIEDPRVKTPKPSKAPFRPISRTSRFKSDHMSTDDIVETVGKTTLDGTKTPTQNDYNPASKEAKTKLSFEDVERLILETDEAFRAVGTALEDAKTSTHTWHKRKTSKSHRYSQDFGIGNVIKLTHGVSTAVATSSQSRPLQLVPRQKKSSTSRTKKETPSKQPPNRSSRLRLREVTANVSDLLSGMVFRTDADELPNRKLPLRELDKSQRRSVDSAASIYTEGATPTDPFHLEGLSSRIEAAQRMLAPPTYPPPATPDLTTKSGYGTKVTPKRPSHSISDGTKLKHNTHPFPASPTTNNNHESLVQKPNPLSTPKNPALRLSTGEHGNIIALQSTAFTWTSPLFHHGPIKIERDIKEQTFQSPQEEALDWTAFQMAILGTMDPDGGDQRDDWEWEADERELDEIMDWWDGFGFAGIGRLEGPPPETTKTAPTQLRDDEKEVYCPPAYTDVELGTILDSSRPSPLKIQQEIAGAWTGKSRSENRLSIADSLPPSPMDLLVLTPLSGDEDVRIPMGFNLGHDLGDFLRWEAKHVQNLTGC